MKSFGISFSFALLVSSICSGQASPRPKTVTFRSSKYHYLVRYPASWYLFTTQLRPELDYLDILNFPPSQRAEGVVLRDGGAEISVGAAPFNIPTLEQWIREDTKFDTQVKQEELKPFGKAPAGCTRIIEVISLSEVGPARNFQRAAFYCSTERGSYVVSLTNWQGDPKQKMFNEVARNVVFSLRTLE